MDNHRLKSVNQQKKIIINYYNYYNNYFHVIMSDSVEVWKGIRQLVNLKSRSGSTLENTCWGCEIKWS